MPESFLHLEREEQSQIYRALAPQLARSPVVLEKDVWVCWVRWPNRRIHALKAKVLLSGSERGRGFGSVFRHQYLNPNLSRLGFFLMCSRQTPRTRAER